MKSSGLIKIVLPVGQFHLHRDWIICVRQFLPSCSISLSASYFCFCELFSVVRNRRWHCPEQAREVARTRGSRMIVPPTRTRACVHSHIDFFQSSSFTCGCLFFFVDVPFSSICHPRQRLDWNPLLMSLPNLKSFFHAANSECGLLVADVVELQSRRLKVRWASPANVL